MTRLERVGGQSSLVVSARARLENTHPDLVKTGLLTRGMEAGGVTTHGLRFTAATRLHELGCSFEQVAAIMGHDTVEMVEKCIEKKRNAQLAIAAPNAGTAAQNSNESEKRSSEK